MKDNFSNQSDLYVKYRPVYPDELYDMFIPLVNSFESAWDCGTGNGQVANKLADYFQTVYASDISEKQVGNARRKPNIIYNIERAENTSFANQKFDLITVGQAIHWFDLEDFYAEVRRTLKPGGIISAFGYSLVRFNPEVDLIIDHIHDNILGEYWDNARKLIENHYKSLPFPFREISSGTISYNRDWTYDELIGYLSTWSALQHYIQKNGNNPLPDTARKLREIWKNDHPLTGNTPVFTRIGRL